MADINQTLKRALDGPVPQHVKQGDLVITSDENPLPVAGYGMTDGGVWIPRKVTDEGYDLTQLTGSIVKYEQVSTAGTSIPAESTLVAVTNIYLGDGKTEKIQLAWGDNFGGAAGNDSVIDFIFAREKDGFDMSGTRVTTVRLTNGEGFTHYGSNFGGKTDMIEPIGPYLQIEVVNNRDTSRYFRNAQLITYHPKGVS